jgi:hypothetical protein
MTADPKLKFVEIIPDGNGLGYIPPFPCLVYKISLVFLFNHLASCRVRQKDYRKKEDPKNMQGTYRF